MWEISFNYKKMAEKKYYTSEEMDLMIKESLLKNAKELVVEIKNHFADVRKMVKL